MATYVLVPGGGWGGFIWRPVAALLRTQGHDVFTPTLTGLGERVHLASQEIDLLTHIQDILGVMVYEDLSEVILVGHSYGGMVITGVAERLPEKLARLVYLDAMVPQDGQSDLDVLGPAIAAQFEEHARLHGDGWCLPPAPDDSPKITAHPLKSLQQPLVVRNPVAALLPRTFIFCTASTLDCVRQTAARAQREGWRYHELPTGHMAMVSMPQEVAHLLLGESRELHEP
jgi:pimeloyl-ACP methyl ester carboxylesterase